MRTGKKAKLRLERETLVALEREILVGVGGGVDGGGGLSGPSVCITQCGRTMDARCGGQL